MHYLIDTHVLLWWLTDNPRLNDQCREILTYKPVCCSVVSLWEILIKEQAGKIKIPDTFMSDLKGQGFIWLEVQFNHIAALRELPNIHKDPFDRLLISQAQTEALVLITSDKTILRYNIPILKPD
jgi:PIN domain nuclease of toxin-antitoxin system